MMENGFTSWLIQKIANGFWMVAGPLMAASDRLDEAAFQAAKRYERRH